MKASGNNTLLYISIALAIAGPVTLLAGAKKKDNPWRYVGPPLVEVPEADRKFLTRIDHIDRIDDRTSLKSEIKRLIPLLQQLPIDRIVAILRTAEREFRSRWKMELTLEAIVLALFEVPDGKRRLQGVLIVRDTGVLFGPAAQSTDDAASYHKKYGFRKNIDDL